MTRETTFGWTASILLHIAAGFMFFVVHPPQPDSQQQEFVEFSFGGGLASSLGPMPKGDALPEGTAPPPIGQTGAPATGVGVDLPTQQHALASDEIINAAPTKKIEANDNPIAMPGERKGMADVQREAPATSTPGFPGATRMPLVSRASPTDRTLRRRSMPAEQGVPSGTIFLTTYSGRAEKPAT